MQRADQISVGYFHNFQRQYLRVSLEAYYNGWTGGVDFADHAALIPNPLPGREVRRGAGRLTAWR